MVLKKENELKAKGFRTFNTSNYTHHLRIPDIIAISPREKLSQSRWKQYGDTRVVSRVCATGIRDYL